MIYRTISSAEIVAKIYRDLGHTIKLSHWEQDAFEWIGEALEHIGAGAQFVKKEAVLPVSSYKAIIPSDMMHLLNVFYSETEEDAKCLLPRSNDFANTGLTINSTNTAAHVLNPDYIQVSYETGFLSLTYLGLGLDDDGFPLVPDHISYREAFFWYILKMLMLGGWKHPDVNITWLFADAKWQRYCTQARNAANMPDVPGYDKFLKSWKKMIPTHGSAADPVWTNPPPVVEDPLTTPPAFSTTTPPFVLSTTGSTVTISLLI